jgi:hypothetical protein
MREPRQVPQVAVLPVVEQATCHAEKPNELSIFYILENLTRPAIDAANGRIFLHESVRIARQTGAC